MILLLLFLVIVISPCMVAFLGGADTGLELFGDKPQPAPADPAVQAVDLVAPPEQVMLEETTLAREFQVRSFAKGLGQRRVLLRDRVGEVRLHIRMLRQAVRQQMRRAGLALDGFTAARRRAAEDRAVLLRRLAAEARAAWERTEAVRAREAALAAERSAGWADAEQYARWRWREQAGEGFEAA